MAQAAPQEQGLRGEHSHRLLCCAHASSRRGQDRQLRPVPPGAPRGSGRHAQRQRSACLHLAARQDPQPRCGPRHEDLRDLAVLLRARLPQADTSPVRHRRAVGGGLPRVAALLARRRVPRTPAQKVRPRSPTSPGAQARRRRLPNYRHGSLPRRHELLPGPRVPPGLLQNPSSRPWRWERGGQDDGANVETAGLGHQPAARGRDLHRPGLQAAGNHAIAMVQPVPGGSRRAEGAGHPALRALPELVGGPSPRRGSAGWTSSPLPLQGRPGLPWGRPDEAGRGVQG